MQTETPTSLSIAAARQLANDAPAGATYYRASTRPRLVLKAPSSATVSPQ